MKTFSEMTAQDYAELGLKAGLEIHQQLLTAKKLFCRCPAGFYSQEFDAEILRHMRPTLSELGEYDGTALMEYKTRKEIIYQINHRTVCTYEMDDTPPFEINPDALDIALEIGMLLNYRLVDEIHIARKQYLDGSIPTGFQRTTIVGIDGHIPFKDRTVSLVQLGLEEDACREVSDFGHQRVYLTDRLGMPLIEMVTGPEMKTPQEVAEVANLLRYLVRSTGKVRTGIGAARQDVNVSITGGTRIEIKGVHRIPLIPLLIYNETMRQHALLKICLDLKENGITEKTFKAESADVTYLLSKSTWDPVRRAIRRGEKVHCVNLKGFVGMLSYPTQTGKVFSKEISDRVRVIACLTRLPNILTSESTEETIESYTWNKIRKLVKASSRDSLILVWGNEEDLKTATQEIANRAKEATLGVPSETRQALADGTNGFERILPGPDRMYPDTDLPPLEILENRTKKIEKTVPEQLWKREIKYKMWGIPEHLWNIIGRSQQAVLFESIIKRNSLAPGKIARLMFEDYKSWKRNGLPVENIKDSNWRELFDMANISPVLLEIAPELLKQFLEDGKPSLTKQLEKITGKNISAKNLKSEIFQLLKKHADDVAAPKQTRYLMGKLMTKFRGHISGAEVNNHLQTALKNNSGGSQ